MHNSNTINVDFKDDFILFSDISYVNYQMWSEIRILLVHSVQREMITKLVSSYSPILNILNIIFEK